MHKRMTKKSEYERIFTSAGKPTILNKLYPTFSYLELYHSIVYDVDTSLEKPLLNALTYD